MNALALAGTFTFCLSIGIPVGWAWHKSGETSHDDDQRLDVDAAERPDGPEAW